jgi:hypothetical protein
MMQGVRVSSCPVNSLWCSRSLRHSYGSSGSSASSAERGAQCECPLHRLHSSTGSLSPAAPHPHPASRNARLPNPTPGIGVRRNRSQTPTLRSAPACSWESIGALERCERRCVRGVWGWARAGTGRTGCGRARAEGRGDSRRAVRGGGGGGAMGRGWWKRGMGGVSGARGGKEGRWVWRRGALESGRAGAMGAFGVLPRGRAAWGHTFLGGMGRGKGARGQRGGDGTKGGLGRVGQGARAL